MTSTDSSVAIPLLRWTRCITHRSRDCVSRGARCISNSSGHAFDAWSR